MTCPKLTHYTATPAALKEMAEALFEVVRLGAVRLVINQAYPLAAATQVHGMLESRQTSGLTVLIP